MNSKIGDAGIIALSESENINNIQEFNIGIINDKDRKKKETGEKNLN